MNRCLLLIILLYSCTNSVKIDDNFSKNNKIENIYRFILCHNG